MNTFLVHFLAPTTSIDAWMQKPEAERKEEEAKMMAEWDAWTEAHKDMFKETKAAGKTKRVTVGGVEDTRNDLMLYSIVEGESHDVIAKTFEGHPHLVIPGATIEIMSIRSM